MTIYQSICKMRSQTPHMVYNLRNTHGVWGELLTLQIGLSHFRSQENVMYCLNDIAVNGIWKKEQMIYLNFFTWLQQSQRGIKRKITQAITSLYKTWPRIKISHYWIKCWSLKLCDFKFYSQIARDSNFSLSNYHS